MLKFYQKIHEKFWNPGILNWNPGILQKPKTIEINNLSRFQDWIPNPHLKSWNPLKGQIIPELQTESGYHIEPYPYRIVSNNKLTIHRRGLGWGMLLLVLPCLFTVAHNLNTLSNWAVEHTSGSIPQTTTIIGGNKQ